MAADNVAPAQIDELSAPREGNGDKPRLGLRDLYKVRLTITAELGAVEMKVRDVLALKVGSLVTLDKLAGQMADVFVNGIQMAKGEIVVMGDLLHIRLAEINGSAGSPDREHK